MEKTKALSRKLFSKASSHRSRGSDASAASSEGGAVPRQSSDDVLHDIPRKPVPDHNRPASRHAPRHVPIEIPSSSQIPSATPASSSGPVPTGSAASNSAPAPASTTTTLPDRPKPLPPVPAPSEYPPGQLQDLGADTTVERTVAPAVVHETIVPHRHEIIQKQIRRDIHEHHVFVKQQPIFDTEILPAKHYTYDENGQLVLMEGFDMGEEWEAAWRQSLVDALLKKDSSNKQG